MKKIILLSLIITIISSVYYAKSQQIFSEDYEKTKVRGIGEKSEVYIQEIKFSKTKINVNSRECIDNLRSFVNYIFSNTPNLFFNHEKQDEFFSNNLKKNINRHLKVYEYGSLAMESSYFPDNSTFIGAWDYPSHYQIIDTREADKNIEIDIQYTWKEGTDYQGETRNLTVFFVFENEKWKIDEVLHHQAKYSNEFYLSEIPWDYWFRK